MEEIRIILENRYVQAGLIVIAFLIGGKIITMVSQGFLSRFAEKTKTKLDDLIISHIRAPFSYFMLFVGLKVALKPLGFDEGAIGHIGDCA